MGPFEGTPLQETWKERTSEFTHFNLVIRLSKVKQSAFSGSLGRSVRVEQWAAVPGFTFSCNCCDAVWLENLLPFQLCSRDGQLHNTLQHE